MKSDLYTKSVLTVIAACLVTFLVAFLLSPRNSLEHGVWLKGYDSPKDGRVSVDETPIPVLVRDGVLSSVSIPYGVDIRTPREGMPVRVTNPALPVMVSGKVDIREPVTVTGSVSVHGVVAVKNSVSVSDALFPSHSP